MAEETSAPAEAVATETAEPAADALTDTQPRADGRADDGKFAAKAPAKAPADAGDAPEWRKVLGKNAEKYTSEAELAKGYTELEKRLSKSLVPPDEKAPPEKQAEWRAKLLKAAGVEVPDSPDGYGLEPVEGMSEQDAANLKAFADVAHKSGMSKAAVMAAIDFVAQHGEATAKAQAEHLQKSMSEAELALRREWHGAGEYDLNVAIAKDAVRTYGDAEFRDIAEMSLATLAQAFPNKSLNELPAFARVWANVGRKTGTAQPVIANSSMGQRTKAELMEMYNSPRYQSGKDPEFMRQVDETWRQYAPPNAA